jgi:surfeit locus 1 family protein
VIRFHPLPRLTVAVAIAIAILSGLGTWQIERLHWKLGLIAEVGRNLTAPMLPLDRALAMGPEAAQYHRVALTGHFENTKEAYVFTTGPEGAPVYHVVTPFLTARGVFLVDRGMVPAELRDPKTRAAGQLEGTRRIVGIWHIPDAPGFFTPAPDFSQHIWYARDVAGLARADGVALAVPVMVEADATPNPGGWPKGGQTVVTFRNEHLQYAITWFGLALALFCIYVVYHWNRSRLDVIWRGRRLWRGEGEFSQSGSDTPVKSD